MKARPMPLLRTLCLFSPFSLRGRSPSVQRDDMGARKAVFVKGRYPELEKK
jgi:hypothetical protein